MNTSEMAHVGHAHPRHAECQKCGWFLPLAKVGRRQQAELGLERSVRWVCDECVLDLAFAASPATVVPHRKLTGQPLLPAPHRSVA